MALHRGAFLVHAAQGDARHGHLTAAVHRDHRDGGEGPGELGYGNLLGVWGGIDMGDFLEICGDFLGFLGVFWGFGKSYLGFSGSSWDGDGFFLGFLGNDIGFMEISWGFSTGYEREYEWEDLYSWGFIGTYQIY